MKTTSDMIGREAEFIHPVQGRRMVGRVINIFANGKVQVSPKFSRDGDTMTPLCGTQKLVNVRADRCEFRKFESEE